MELKLNDVYRFCYNKIWIEKIFMPDHCFDRQLIVRGDENGLYLRDTYWGSGEGKSFTLEEALKKGILTFVCNLDDVEEIKEYDTQYYADGDIFDLSSQHHCYRKFYIKKGVSRLSEKMKAVLNEKITKSKHEIEWETFQIKRNEEKLQELENGNIDIYI